MVWIYGGGFNFGGTALYDGRQLAGLHDVVVVTITFAWSFAFLRLIAGGSRHAKLTVVVGKDSGAFSLVGLHGSTLVLICSSPLISSRGLRVFSSVLCIMVSGRLGLGRSCSGFGLTL